jgi:hypothetical protein
VAHFVDQASGRVTVRVELDLNLSPAQQRPSSSPLDPQCSPSVEERARPDEQAAHKERRTESAAPGERNEAMESDALLSVGGGGEEHGPGEEQDGAPPEDNSHSLPTTPGSEAEDMDMQASVPSPSPKPQQPTDSSITASDSPPEFEGNDPSESDGSDEEESPGEDLYQHWAQKLEQERAQRTGHARQGGPTFRCAMCTSGRGKLRVFPHLAALIRHAETVTSGPRTAAHVAYARALSELEEKLGEGKAGKKLAKLSDPEKVVVPPVVVAQNLRTKFDQERGQWNGLSEKVLEKSFRAKGYEFEKIKPLWNAQGHRGIALVFFAATEGGLLRAKQLDESQERQGRGRPARDAGESALEPDGGPQVFCYLATVRDMCALDPDRRLGWREETLQALLFRSVRERDERKELELSHAKARSELRAAKGRNRALEGEKEELERQNEELKGEVERIRAATEQANVKHTREVRPGTHVSFLRYSYVAQIKSPSPFWFSEDFRSGCAMTPIMILQVNDNKTHRS